MSKIQVPLYDATAPTRASFSFNEAPTHHQSILLSPEEVAGYSKALTSGRLTIYVDYQKPREYVESIIDARKIIWDLGNDVWAFIMDKSTRYDLLKYNEDAQGYPQGHGGIPPLFGLPVVELNITMRKQIIVLHSCAPKAKGVKDVQKELEVMFDEIPYNIRSTYDTNLSTRPDGVVPERFLSR